MKDRKHNQRDFNSYLFSTSINPLPRVFIINPTADLEVSWPGCQGLTRGVFIAGTQHDDMRTQEIVVSVQAGIVARRVF